MPRPESPEAVVQPRRSSRIAPCRGREHRQDQRPDVEQQRPVVDIVDVMGDTALDLLVATCLAAEPVHLRPAGDPGLDALPGGVGGQLAAQLLVVRDRMRPWSHEAHLAYEN